MTGKTHVAMGIAAGLTLSHGQSPENQLILVLASMVGSLIPDLDHPKGKLNQKILWINNGLYRMLFYLALGSILMYLNFVKNNKYLMLLGLVFILIGISSHRGFTHSIVGFLLSASVVKMGTSNYGLDSLYSGFMVGYVLHLVADFFTPRGIRLFYPLKISVSSPINIKTGNYWERIIFTILSIYCVFVLMGYIG